MIKTDYNHSHNTYIWFINMVYVDNKTLSSNLNRLQKEAKYSNLKLGKLTMGGVSDRYIGNIKNNDHSPSLEIIKSLARVFKMEPWELLLPTDHPSNKTNVIYDEDLRKVVENYLASTEKGRNLISLVAAQSEKK